MSGLQSRFDWYSATFDTLEDDRVPRALAAVFDAAVTLSKGKMGYAHMHTIERDDRVLARVFSGSARLGEVHVVVTSDACDKVVPLIRRLWPDHRVSRVDSAVDFSADFAALDDLALSFADARRLSYRLVTDSDGGATRYLGSPSSEVMVRIYKKSEQLRRLHPEQAAEVPDGIVRVELQLRPSSKMKSRVASMTSDDVFGLSQWTTDFAAEFLHFEAERVPTHFRQPSDWLRAMHWIGQQYGPSVIRRVEQVGMDRAKQEVLAALGLGDLDG